VQQYAFTTFILNSRDRVMKGALRQVAMANVTDLFKYAFIELENNFVSKRL